MQTKKELEQAAIADVLAGLRDGSIMVRVVTACSLCKTRFDTAIAYEAHLIDGKTIDVKTGKPRRICPR